MAQLNLMFPILPGQKDAHKALLDHIHADKREEFDARCQRLGVNWERGFYMDSPAGTVFLLVLDLEDPASFMPNLLAAPSSFEQWFMTQMGPIHGLDPAAAKHMPMPEKVLDWRAEGKAAHGKPTTAMAVPVLDVPGWKAFLDLVMSQKPTEFAAERARLGVSRETHYLHQTPMGAFTVIAMECDNPAGFAHGMGTPVNEFGTWFLQQVATFNGFTPEAAAHLVMPTVCHDFERSKAGAVTH